MVQNFSNFFHPFRPRNRFLRRGPLQCDGSPDATGKCVAPSRVASVEARVRVAYEYHAEVRIRSPYSLDGTRGAAQFRIDDQGCNRQVESLDQRHRLPAMQRGDGLAFQVVEHRAKPHQEPQIIVNDEDEGRAGAGGHFKRFAISNPGA